MSRESIVVLLGLVVFFTPHLGIPEDWRLYITSGAGVVLILVGYSLRRSAFRRRLERSAYELGNESFTEHHAEPGPMRVEQSH